jgi:hypothetical protein
MSDERSKLEANDEMDQADEDVEAHKHMKDSTIEDDDNDVEAHKHMQ